MAATLWKCQKWHWSHLVRHRFCVKFSHNLMTRGPWDRTQFLWESAMGKLTFNIISFMGKLTVHSPQILYSLKYCSKLGAWSKFTMGRKFMLLAALPKNMRLNSLNRKGPVASKCWGSWQALESSRAGEARCQGSPSPDFFLRACDEWFSAEQKCHFSALISPCMDVFPTQLIHNSFTNRHNSHTCYWPVVPHSDTWKGRPHILDWFCAQLQKIFSNEKGTVQ